MLEKEQIALIRSLKGAAASIVLALYLAGVQLSGSELQVVTGYDENEVTSGLELLFVYDLISNSRSTTRALFLSSSTLYSLRSVNMLVDHQEEEESFLSSKGGTGGRSNEEENERSLADRSGAMSNEERESAPPDRAALLRSLGVGPGSLKMAELMCADIDYETIQAWGIERRWWVKERARTNARYVDGRSMFTVGTLIRILLDGDRPPPARCAECLERLPCYCGVVKR